MLLSPSATSKLKESLKEKVFFGNEPTPELIAILLIYFVQGILGLARLAVSFFLKDELGMSPAEVSAMLGVVALPWIIKPVFGFMSDGLPIFGYRRRPYIVLSGLLGMVSMGEPRNNCTHTACSYRRDRPEFPGTCRQRRNRRLPGSRKGQKRIRYRRWFPAILVLGRFSPRRTNYRLPQRFPAATLQHPDNLFNHRIFPANCISNSLVNCRRKNQQKNRL